MTYKEIVTYIEEIPRFTRKHSLDHTREMLLFLGNPQNGKKIIHVAGTNGKGSVCAYLDAMLRAEGKSTGLFTSPHLVKMNERIVLNGKQISDEDFCEVFEETMQAVRRMQDTIQNFGCQTEKGKKRQCPKEASGSVRYPQNQLSSVEQE